MPSACRFRPCIDLHQGKVKQIVGSSLSDDPSKGPITNFEAEGSSADFAAMYAKDRLLGGHVIKLGPNNEEAALGALRAYPGGLQIGGGVTPANALSYLEAGASHVIVTSYVFSEGRLDAARLAEVVKVVGRERLVLDLSCRRREPGGPFFVVTDRWQKFTDLEVSEATLRELSAHCVEFLVHAVDVEGKQSGIEEDLVKALGQCRRRLKSKPAPARPPVPPVAAPTASGRSHASPEGGWRWAEGSLGRRGPSRGALRTCAHGGDSSRLQRSGGAPYPSPMRAARATWRTARSSTSWVAARWTLPSAARSTSSAAPSRTRPWSSGMRRRRRPPCSRLPSAHSTCPLGCPGGA